MLIPCRCSWQFKILIPLNYIILFTVWFLVSNITMYMYLSIHAHTLVEILHVYVLGSYIIILLGSWQDSYVRSWVGSYKSYRILWRISNRVYKHKVTLSILNLQLIKKCSTWFYNSIGVCHSSAENLGHVNWHGQKEGEKRKHYSCWYVVWCF